ncbi:MAG: hypothetical protein DYG89_43940 [Caldilinea sp. CFX5]|nr:hypothetical protein [Caldilinea sp. CFX5]
MTDAIAWSNWLFWLMIVAVVILAAAVLLVLVWWTANRILQGAVRALGLVQQIKANTEVIWALEATNQTATRILADATAIRDNGATLAQALHDVDERRRSN